jgi:O-antigen ligase/polysaccharide polymerase Wzy-like membrane protein
VTSVVQSAVLAPAEPEVRSSSGVRTIGRAAFAAVLCTVAIAPFERVLIGIPGGFTLTTVEAAILASLAAGLWVAATSRPAGSGLSPVLLPGLALVALVALAALVAPLERGNALRFAGRLAAAASVAFVVAQVVDTEARARTVVYTFVAVALCVAIVAVLESAQVPWVLQALTVFRPGFHVVGGQLRATSTLFYPTIASMYLELAFACGLWLLYSDRKREGSDRREWVSTAVAFVALAVIGMGITATFTRAGLFGMAAALSIVGGVRVARLGLTDAAIGRLVALAALMVTVVLAMHSPELLLSRIRSEGSQAWYGARYEVPVTLELDTGRMHQIPITLTNTGSLTWDSTRQPAYAVSYHWLRAGSEAVVQFDGQRTPFAAPVPPGATVTMPVFVTAPGQAGTYTLVWDVVLESRAWLSTEGVPPAHTLVRVEGEPSSVVRTTMTHLPQAIVRPGRLALWSAALRITREHPLLGIGPDNYRHVYGRYLGLDRFDDRVHANDMYLEVLAGAGVLGFSALVWLLSAWGLALLRRCRDVPREALMPAAAALAAWLMIAAHGLVDSFLSFTTTYLSFAIVLGLSFSRAWARLDSRALASLTPAARGHAHRI